MPRFLTGVIVACLLFVACAGSEPGSSPSTPPGTSGGSVATDAAGPAPDFTLALGSGDEFRLADEAKPVYLVFWAEW